MASQGQQQRGKDATGMSLPAAFQQMSIVAALDLGGQSRIACT